MKVYVCRCKQCKASKKAKRQSVRRFFKRYASKWRRKAKEGEALNFYWS